MKERRRLRKAEREQLDALVTPALADALPFVNMIEGVVIDQHLGGVPDDLQGEFVREFMNEVGRVLFAGFDLHLEASDEPPD